MKLTAPTLLEHRAFIGGDWLEAAGGATVTVQNPATGQACGTVPDLSAKEITTAIDAARAAFPSWSMTTATERARLLERWHALILQHADDLAAILTTEMGKPLKESLGEISYGASFISWFAEEAKRAYGEIIPTHLPDRRLLVLRQPVGVVGAITPWNFPNAMITRKIAPALAVGCTVIVKPAKQTPLSALALGRLAEMAGFPPGVINVVTTAEGATAGTVLCEDERVRKITFTGSTEVGRILMRQCAAQIKKVSLELGGNAPFIVFDDADLEIAVEAAMMSKFRNCGQTCVSSNRIYVQDGILESFTSRLKARIETLRVGDGFDDAAEVGPLIDDAALRKTAEHVEDARKKGATVVTGGHRHRRGGRYFEPTLLTGMRDSMRIAREETFGPVAPVFTFRDDADVIARANDTIYGLAAYFMSRDLSRVWRVAEALEYGMVGVNTGIISTAVAPFGGVKQSGLGREGSRHGLDDFMETKYVCMAGISAP